MILDDHEEIERTVLYRLFAHLFMSRPTREILSLAREMLQMQSDETVELVEMDFAHIFMGPWKHLPPYESLYEQYIPGELGGPEERIAHGLKSFYTSVGLAMDMSANLTPDHISSELLFMSYLAENNFVDYQKRFLEEHLLKWVPGYCDEVHRHAATAFYKEIANLLKEFILSECREFGIQAKPY